MYLRFHVHFTSSSSSSSAFPAISLGFTILGEIFVSVTPFFSNPTLEVVTFRLRGWCMLGIHPSRT